jgi:pilus assembly protein CpaE
MAILLDSDRESAAQYTYAIDGAVKVVETWPLLTKELADQPQEVLVVIGPDAPLEPALSFAEAQRLARPALGVVLLRRRLDVTVLGSALRAGIREVVPPDDINAVAEACRRSVEVSHRALGWQPTDTAATEGRVITVFAAKGGCGKTTMATNLAATLAAGGTRSVCLVDLDLSFGDVAIAMQLFPTRSMADAVTMRDTLDEAGVRSLLTPHSPGLDTLLAPLDPGDAEKIPTAVVSEVLGVLRRSYDYVVVDTPPDFKEWVLAALDLSDLYVLLATLDVPAVKNLRLTLDMLDLLGYPRENWQVVLNRSDSRVGLNVADVEKTLKVPIAAQVPSSKVVSASINKGVPLVLEQPNHAISVALRDFVDGRILGEKSGRKGQAGKQASKVINLVTKSDVDAPKRGLLRRKVVAT